MLATMLSFMAYATFVTYLRPFLEQVTGVNPNVLSAILLAFGIANFLGATFASYPLKASLKRSLMLLPILLCIAVFYSKAHK